MKQDESKYCVSPNGQTVQYCSLYHNFVKFFYKMCKILRCRCESIVERLLFPRGLVDSSLPGQPRRGGLGEIGHPAWLNWIVVGVRSQSQVGAQRRGANLGHPAPGPFFQASARSVPDDTPLPALHVFSGTCEGFLVQLWENKGFIGI